MDINKADLKEDLQRIEKEQYQLREGEQHQKFVTQMLHYIGDPDPELRAGGMVFTMRKMSGWPISWIR